MRKARDLVGLPVIDTLAGEHQGEVRDVLFAPDGRLHSLLLEKGGLLTASRIVPKANISSIGQDAVTIRTRDDIECYRDETGLIRSLLDGDVPYVGKDVLTANGSLLGTVEDVYIDDELHTIVGYEISEGFLVDLTEGRKVLRTHPDMMFGMDALLVPEDVELAGDLGDVGTD